MLQPVQLPASNMVPGDPSHCLVLPHTEQDWPAEPQDTAEMTVWLLRLGHKIHCGICLVVSWMWKGQGGTDLRPPANSQHHLASPGSESHPRWSPSPGQVVTWPWPHLTSRLQSRGDHKQNHPTNPLLNSWPTDTEIIHICHFKPLHFEVICHAEIDSRHWELSD